MHSRFALRAAALFLSQLLMITGAGSAFAEETAGAEAPAAETAETAAGTPVRSVYRVEQEEYDIPLLETAASLEDLAYYVAFFRNEMNLNDAMTAALLANIERESAFRTTAVDGARDTYGLFQWLGTRKDGLMSFAKEHGLAPDARETQLRFLQYELEVHYPGVLWQLNAWEDYRDNAADAAAMFSEVYEGVADVALEALVRSRLARDFFYDLLSEPTLNSLAAEVVIPALPAPPETLPVEETPAPEEPAEPTPAGTAEAEPEAVAVPEAVPEEPAAQTPEETSAPEEALPAEEIPEETPEPEEPAASSEAPSVTPEEQEYLDKLGTLLDELRESVERYRKDDIPS